MAKLGGIYVDVRAKTDKYKKDLSGAKTSAQKTSKAIQKQFDSINFKKALIGLTAVAAGITVVIKKSVELANEQEAVEKRLEAVITATGNAAGYNTDQLIAMAGAMQKVTTTGDEVIISGMAVLATFKQIRGEGFERATQAALDMSEVMQSDLRSSIVMIGKALNDPIANLSAMSRAGVQFTKQQKDMVKALWNTGRAAEAQAIILDELESQFGGAAAAARDTFGGAMKAAANAFGDIQEQIGSAITKNSELIKLVQEAEQWFVKAGDAVGAWVAANDKLIAQRTHEAIESIRKTVEGLMTIYNSLPDGVVGAAGVGIIGRILFGGSVGKLLFVLSMVNTQMGKIGNSLGDLVEKHKAANKAIVKLWDSIWEAVKGPGDIMYPVPEFPGLEFDINKGTAGYQAYLDSFKKKSPTLPPQIATGKPDTFLLDSKIAAIKEEEKIRAKAWQSEIEWMNHIIEKEKEAEGARLEIVKGFNEEYNEIGKTRFDLEREQVERMTEIYREAGVEENRIAKIASEKNIEIARAEQMAKLDIYQGIAGGVADTFLKISQAGIKQSKEAFFAYKAFAIIEATIAGHKAITNALATPLPWPLPMAMATMAGAATAVQIGMIASSQPPSYDTGGVSSARGVYQTGNIQEAHVPIPSGKIPVEINGGKESQEIVIMNTVDPSVMDRYMASSRGQNAIMNVIGNNPQAVRRISR